MDNFAEISSEEELLRLRDEGKISDAEYQDLLAAIRKSRPSEREVPDKSNSCTFWLKTRLMEKKIPGPLWIALISLSVMVVLKVLFAFMVGPAILIDAAWSGVLLVGLYLGHKWAYVLTIVTIAIGTVLGFSKGVANGLGILVLDCLVLVPVLVCTEYFFPKISDINRQCRRLLLASFVVPEQDLETLAECKTNEFAHICNYCGFGQVFFSCSSLRH